MATELDISGSARGVSGQSYYPFVGYKIPFIGHIRPLLLPFICHKLPLVTNTRKQGGFTLVELMITLVILGVLSAIAAPAVRDMVMNNRLVTETNDMLVSLMLARSEAIKRSTSVFLCKTPDPQASPPVCDATAAWTNGWIIYTETGLDGVYTSGTSDVLIRLGDGFPGTGNKIKLIDVATLAAVDSFSFTRLGLLTEPSMLFFICDNRGNNLAKVIDIFSTGRSRVNRNTAANCA